MNRARLLLLAGCVLLTGCGGSVADRDRPPPARDRPAATSPFCSAVRASNEALAPLSSVTARAVPAEELTNTADAVRRSTTQLLNAAPQDIRPDVERYVAVVNLQLDALVANGGDGAALARDPAFRAQVDNPENTAANQRVRDYVMENCAP